MRRRNKKKRKMDVSMIPVPFAVVVALVATLGLGYVWLGSRCDCLGKEIKALEAKKADLDRKLLNEEYKWTRMKSPANIELTLAKFGVEMTWPRRDQVIRRCASDVAGLDLDAGGDRPLRYASIARDVVHE